MQKNSSQKTECSIFGYRDFGNHFRATTRGYAFDDDVAENAPVKLQ